MSREIWQKISVQHHRRREVARHSPGAGRRRRRSGTLVFDIKDKLPKTMQLLREYKVTLNGLAGNSDAPQKRTVRIGGDITLVC